MIRQAGLEGEFGERVWPRIFQMADWGGGRQLRGAGACSEEGKLRQQASFFFQGSMVFILSTICRRELAMAQSLDEECRTVDGMGDSSESEVNTDDQSHAPQSS